MSIRGAGARQSFVQQMQRTLKSGSSRRKNRGGGAESKQKSKAESQPNRHGHSRRASSRDEAAALQLSGRSHGVSKSQKTLPKPDAAKVSKKEAAATGNSTKRADNRPTVRSAAKRVVKALTEARDLVAQHESRLGHTAKPARPAGKPQEASPRDEVAEVADKTSSDLGSETDATTTDVATSSTSAATDSSTETTNTTPTTAPPTTEVADLKDTGDDSDPSVTAPTADSSNQPSQSVDAYYKQQFEKISKQFEELKGEFEKLSDFSDELGNLKELTLNINDGSGLSIGGEGHTFNIIAENVTISAQNVTMALAAGRSAYLLAGALGTQAGSDPRSKSLFDTLNSTANSIQQQNDLLRSGGFLGLA